MVPVPSTNRPRLAALRLNLTTEVEWLIPNLLLRSGLILHAATALHCKTTGIFPLRGAVRRTAYTALLPLLPSLITSTIKPQYTKND